MRVRVRGTILFLVLVQNMGCAEAVHARTYTRARIFIRIHIPMWLYARAICTFFVFIFISITGFRIYLLGFSYLYT
ncbi:hypothetical protein DFH27DRAFT_568974, partial [Peziza echinospora]